MHDVIEMANYLGLDPQAAGESERDFRLRVAAELRARGQIVEAHEIACGRRFDDPDASPMGSLGSPLTGVAGAIAAALGGIDYGDRSRVDDEAVIGALALAPPDPARAAIAEAFDLLGPAALDLFGGGR